MSNVVAPLCRLIGKSVNIDLGKTTERKAEIYGFSVQNGWLLFNANGTLKVKSYSLPEDCVIWNPDKKDFPKKECAVFFPAIIIEETEDVNYDEYSCDWSFEDSSAEKIVNDIIDDLLKRAKKASKKQ